MSAWPSNVSTLNSDVLYAMHNIAQSQPTNPVGILGGTAKMLGLGVTFRPIRGTRVEVTVTGNVSDDTTADAASFILRYGTGTAPTNGAASTGTAGSLTRTFTALTGMTKVPFAEHVFISGLTTGTTYWFDYSAAATGAGATANMDTLNVTIKEI